MFNSWFTRGKERLAVQYLPNFHNILPSKLVSSHQYDITELGRDTWYHNTVLRYFYHTCTTDISYSIKSGNSKIIRKLGFAVLNTFDLIASLYNFNMINNQFKYFLLTVFTLQPFDGLLMLLCIILHHDIMLKHSSLSPRYPIFFATPS